MRSSRRTERPWQGSSAARNKTSQTRKELFTKLSSLWDQIQTAHAAQNAAEEARLRIEYNNTLHPKAPAGQ